MKFYFLEVKILYNVQKYAIKLYVQWIDAHENKIKFKEKGKYRTFLTLVKNVIIIKNVYILTKVSIDL